MRLIVLHYHDRPGGVRSVITRCLPALVQTLGNVSEVMIACGEIRDRVWLNELARQCGTKFSTHTNAALGYASSLPGDHPQQLRQQVREACEALFRNAPGETLVWAHNLSIGRNAALAAELPAVCASHQAILALHQHDWWFDGRWDRAGEFPRLGLRTAEQIEAAFFPRDDHIRMFCINPSDADGAAAVTGRAVKWLPHPCPDTEPPPAAELREARAWLMEWTGGAPAWLYPCRWLARKNVAEALFLSRNLTNGEAWLCTTGGPSSAAEEEGWEHLRGAAAASGWRYLPGILQTGERAPSLPALMCAADVIVHSSVREGFGLVPPEAALLERPLLVRWPAVARSLEPSGLICPWQYDTLPVPRGLLRETPPRLSGSERSAIQRMDFVQRVFGKTVPPASREDSPFCDFGALDPWSQIAVLNAPEAETRSITAHIPASSPEPARISGAWRSFGAGAWAEQFVAELHKLPEIQPAPGGASAFLKWILQSETP